MAKAMTEAEILALPYRPCVGVMLVNTSGRIFSGRRIDNPGPAWQMPQGGIDPGEDPKTAALRELHEETGVTADLVEIVGETHEWLKYELPHDLVPKLWKGRYRGQKQRWFLMRFLGKDQDVNIATEIPEFSEWAWKDREDLLNSIVPFKRDLYSAVFSAFSKSI